MINKKVVVIRDAALGDVINTECVVRALHLAGYERIYYQSSYSIAFAEHPNICWDKGPYSDVDIINLDNTYEKNLKVNIHEAYLASCGLAACPVARQPRLYLTETEMSYGHETLDPKYRWVILCVGYPNGPQGRPWWPGDHWIEAVRGIQELGFKVAQVGNLRNNTDFCPVVDLDLRNKTTIRQLMSVIHASDYYFGISSACMVMSQAMKKPGVAIFSPLHSAHYLASAGSMICPVNRSKGSPIICSDLLFYFKITLDTFTNNTVAT